MWADHVKDIDSERRLRIAYFSQDLNNHPVGRFLEPLLNSHDRNKFEIICISCSDNNDSKTEDLRGLSDKWLDVSNKDDLSAARLIAETQPDLLVELGGYTGGQRLRILTARPAPIQLSYLGYFASTHLESIDGWIGDKIVFPSKLEEEAKIKNFIDSTDAI